MVTVEQAGVDTWSLAWRVREGSPAARAIAQLANVKVARGAVMEDRLAGHKVGWFPSAHLVFAEGHPGGELLGRGDELAGVALVVEEALHAYGIPVPMFPAKFDGGFSIGFQGVRRLDITADLRFEAGAEGLATLAGIAAVQLPRMKSNTWRSTRGHIETVAFHGYSGKRMLGRWYDKGIESSCAPRGTLIRPEDQRRWGSGQRRELEEMTNAYVRDKFAARFRPLWQATKGITVAGHSIIAERLAQLVRDDEITPRMAESLMGYATFEANGVELPAPARTKRRRRRELRGHGLVMADDALQEVEVDLSAVMETALSSDLWGSG